MGDRPSEPVHLDEHAGRLYEAVHALLREIDEAGSVMADEPVVLDVEAVMAAIRGETE
jgi:phosphatidate phosphatase PAH1